MTTSPGAIRLLLADIDGTLVTDTKVLTDRTIAAVRMLADAGVLFAVVSGRPPRGMSMLVEPLGLTTPIAAFNGGLIVDTEMHTLVQHVLPRDLISPITSLLRSSSLDVWLYRGADWYVQDPKGAHVAKESATVQFGPTVVEDYSDLIDDVAKIVGVSDDADKVAAAGEAARDHFGDHVSAAASQPCYIDVTHPEANKGFVTPLAREALRRSHQPDRHDRRYAQRRAHIRALRAQHRHGQCESRGSEGRSPGHYLQRGRGLRQRCRALRAADRDEMTATAHRAKSRRGFIACKKR
jgi:HAD superfamily hydrolase (TIGR01484 family)